MMAWLRPRPSSAVVRTQATTNFTVAQMSAANSAASWTHFEVIAVARTNASGTACQHPAVGRDRRTLLGLMLSSQAHHADDRNWIGIGSGDWDYDGKPSWVRLDRVLDVPEEGIRREGAILDQPTFELVAARLRAEYSWS